jgi:hypothetical protein
MVAPPFSPPRQTLRDGEGEVHYGKSGRIVATGANASGTWRNRGALHKIRYIVTGFVLSVVVSDLPAELIEQAERLLDVRIDRVEAVTTPLIDERPHIRRLHFDGGTAILRRRIAEDPDDPLGHVGREWAASVFLEMVGIDVAPRCLGGDRELRFVLLEDLGDGETLADALLISDADHATGSLARLGASLGRIHGATAGQRKTFDRVLEEIGARMGDRGLATGQGHNEFRQLCENLDVAWTPSLDREIQKLYTVMGSPEEAHVLVHGDPCPDNCSIDQEQVRIFDFDMSGFAHPSWDASYARIVFPTCWCMGALPDTATRAFEDAYRLEASQAIEPWRDAERFDRAMTDGSAAWLIATTPDLVARNMEEDGRWGIATCRQRVLHRLKIFSASGGRQYPELSECCVSLERALAHRWPGTESLPVYPAFR